MTLFQTRQLLGDRTHCKSQAFPCCTVMAIVTAFSFIKGLSMLFAAFSLHHSDVALSRVLSRSLPTFVLMS